ncbi:Fip1 motif-domain-containing protein, partial [Dimargaris cristalligena]
MDPPNEASAPESNKAEASTATTTTAPASNSVIAPATASSTEIVRKGGLSLDTVGQFNGQDIYDYDIDGADDKPWNRPGADITDYFNYGLNDTTWKIYCQRQKQIREDFQQKKK